MTSETFTDNTPGCSTTYHCSVSTHCSHIRIHDGCERVSFTHPGFVELVRRARSILSVDEARAIALYYAGFLKEGEDPRFEEEKQ